MHDPRLTTVGGGASPGSLIDKDPPEHDRLRRLVMQHFDQSAVVRPMLEHIVTGLIDTMKDRRQVDVVDDLA